MANDAEPLIKIEEVATRLALEVCGVRSLVRRKVIPSFKISRRCTRFRWSEVEAAVNRYRQREIS